MYSNNGMRDLIHATSPDRLTRSGQRTKHLALIPTFKCVQFKLCTGPWDRIYRYTAEDIVQ